MNYLFAGGKKAAERLCKLNDVFSKSSGFFVRNFAKRKVNVCIDLGCGTGHTTRDLTSRLCPAECVGLDNSNYFIEEARKLSKNYRQIKYRLHDVTKIPFPCKNGDVIYARFLLTHLKNPVGCIKKWSKQMNPEGMLLFEETEAIKTNIPVFQKYITIAEQVLKANENLLYTGKFLDNANYEPEFKKKFSGIYNVPAAVKDAAKMFLLNLPSWKDNEFIQKNYNNIEIGEMEGELLKLSKTGESNNNNNLFIEWDLRQVALVKN